MTAIDLDAIRAFVAEIRDGDYEDRAWMIGALERSAEEIDALLALVPEPPSDDALTLNKHHEPASEDEREALIAALRSPEVHHPDHCDCQDGENCEGIEDQADRVSAAGFRRPRPLDREEIARVIAPGAFDPGARKHERQFVLRKADAVIAVIEGRAS